jgi:hypothetical protein
VTHASTIPPRPAGRIGARPLSGSVRTTDVPPIVATSQLPTVPVVEDAFDSPGVIRVPGLLARLRSRGAASVSGIGAEMTAPDEEQ